MTKKQRIAKMVREIEQAGYLQEFLFENDGNLFLCLVFDIVESLEIAARVTDAAQRFYR